MFIFQLSRFVQNAHAEEGTEVQLSIRGKMTPAKVRTHQNKTEIRLAGLRDPHDLSAAVSIPRRCLENPSTFELTTK